MVKDIQSCVKDCTGVQNSRNVSIFDTQLYVKCEKIEVQSEAGCVWITVWPDPPTRTYKSVSPILYGSYTYQESRMAVARVKVHNVKVLKNKIISLWNENRIHWPSFNCQTVCTRLDINKWWRWSHELWFITYE